MKYTLPHCILFFILCLTASIYAANGLGTIGTPSGVPTFECIGLTLSFSGDDNKNSKCDVEYAVKGQATWKKGHPMWIDYRLNAAWGINSRQYRGSIVDLTPNTTYQIRLNYTDADGGSGSQTLEVTTWKNTFPWGQVNVVNNRTTTLSILQSGTPDAYRVYQSPVGLTSTIDAANSSFGIDIRANYVIIRGLKIINALSHGIIIGGGCHDVVIEDCDISNWGPSGIGRLQNFDYSKASGIYCAGGKDQQRIIIQHNTIHNPRGGSNSWSDGHPMGPHCIVMIQTGGNHVIRYNNCYSAGADHYFNDVIGGGENGKEGNFKRDTDIYGNIFSHCYDDGIEAEGLDINIRIWGNYIHTSSMYAIATANVGWTSYKIDNSLGPMYLFRNVIQNSGGATKIRWDGGYYFYHNTVLKTVGGGLEAPYAPASQETKITGDVRNNINEASRPMNSGDPSRWFFDYNLYSKSRSSVNVASSWEAHGVFGTAPQYDIVGNSYYLKAGTAGIDVGEKIPNFSDRYAGAGPDMGACESGVYSMKVGPHGDGSKPYVKNLFFSCEYQTSAALGSPFGFKMKYENLTGSPSTIKVIKKPVWVTVALDSVYGIAPNTPIVDTLIAVVSAGAESETLNLAIYVSAVFIFEAESGTIGSPMQIIDVATASGGKSISTPAGTGNTIFPNVEASYPFNVTQADTYYVWLRLFTQTFNPQVNYGTIAGFNGTYKRPGAVNQNAGQYEWIMYPVSFNLSAGANTFILGHGNEQVQIDKIIITNCPLNQIPGVTGTLPKDKKNVIKQKSNLSIRPISSGAIEFITNHPFELSIVDISGRKVWSQGSNFGNRIIWNTQNENSPISNGTYFIVLKPENGLEMGTKKITVIR